jgi:ribonuclease-3
MARPVADLVASLGFDPEAAAALWQQALTHRSAEGQPHYERLEYLGDAVLKLVVSQWLYERHPGLNEGEMTKVRARVVSDETLANVARRMELGEHLVLGPAEKRSRGKTKVGILASALEAVLGAIYLTHGYARAEGFMDEWLADELRTSLEVGGQDNYKAVLQEYTQSRFKALPEYRMVAEIGPEHDRSYDVEVWVAGERRGAGRGRSKKAAEQQAAQDALGAIRGGAAPLAPPPASP